jgi:hypothetical protein
VYRFYFDPDTDPDTDPDVYVIPATAFVV